MIFTILALAMKLNLLRHYQWSHTYIIIKRASLLGNAKNFLLHLRTNFAWFVHIQVLWQNRKNTFVHFHRKYWLLETIQKPAFTSVRPTVHLSVHPLTHFNNILFYTQRPVFLLYYTLQSVWVWAYTAHPYTRSVPKVPPAIMSQ